MSQPIRVALVEDQNVTREGLSLLIGGSPGFVICGQYDSMEEALNQIPRSHPDVLLADIGLPGMSGIEGVRRIHELMPELAILMLTVHEDSDSVFSAVCAGACGYLLKETPPARLLESIRELYEGGAPYVAWNRAEGSVDVSESRAPQRGDATLAAATGDPANACRGPQLQSLCCGAGCRPGHSPIPCPENLRAAARTLALGGRVESAARRPPPRQQTNPIRFLPPSHVYAN